ncbi:Na+/H+ antiporter subunit D [Blastococcus sp. Marseille-P5729]|uniref:Na+/H+ antiporter subunit D n=1 Tax=Blastococcus sp. Marseille-P5729 TaxID=2086582 RepID=UPI000D1140A5|nr:Na+/H+ antiporter subunit D [Blastococcus sp. Marseille-P5729]
MSSNLLALPVLVPFIGAGIALVLGRSTLIQRIVSLLALATNVVISAALVVQASSHGIITLWVGSWRDPVGIALVADRLAALMLLVSAVVSFFVLIFAISQGWADRKIASSPISVFFPTYLALNAGISSAFLAGDLFNLFVSFEILLFASYVLITLSATGKRVRAGTTYVVVALVSSFLFLVAIAATYAATGTVNMAQLSQRLPEIPSAVSLSIQLLLLVVFGTKAAIFPLHAWLPDSYPTAPSSVTAVFAGLLTKVGVYAIIRMQTLLFPHSSLVGLLTAIALLTMIVGIFGALAQSGIKRMLSFALVSHIGYMIWGIALATESGFSAAIFYVVHHIVIQAALFLVVGLIERAGGSTSLLRLGGLAAVSPLLGILYFVPALNLGGIPPFSGFLAKVGLIRASIDLGTPAAYALIAGGLVTSLLTLYAVMQAWNQAFWRTPAEALIVSGARAPDLDPQTAIRKQGYEVDLDLDAIDEETVPSKAMPLGMVLSASALIVVSLALSVVAGPLADYTNDAAAQLMLPSEYAGSVLNAQVHR